MSWRDFFSGLDRVRTRIPGVESKLVSFPGASLEDLAHLEARLEARLPSSLRSLLLETNGVMGMIAIDGGEWMEDQWLIWPVADLIDQNVSCRTGGDPHLRYRTEEERFRREHDLSHRAAGRPLFDLVFFASAGCDGILFGFPVTRERNCEGNVLVWDPIEDELTEVAGSVEELLKGWMTGAITV